MNPLNAYLAQSIMDERFARAEAHRRAVRHRQEPPRRYESVTIRRATPDDWSALERLAALEGRDAPAGPALVAEVEDRVLAAIWLQTHTVLTDPFQPTAELVALLEARSAQLGASARAVLRPFRKAAALVRRAA
jgi:hypothetical protein